MVRARSTSRYNLIPTQALAPAALRPTAQPIDTYYRADIPKPRLLPTIGEGAQVFATGLARLGSAIGRREKEQDELARAMKSMRDSLGGDDEETYTSQTAEEISRSQDEPGHWLEGSENLPVAVSFALPEAVGAERLPPQTPEHRDSEAAAGGVPLPPGANPVQRIELDAYSARLAGESAGRAFSARLPEATTWSEDGWRLDPTSAVREAVMPHLAANPWLDPDDEAHQDLTKSSKKVAFQFWKEVAAARARFESDVDKKRREVWGRQQTDAAYDELRRDLDRLVDDGDLIGPYLVQGILEKIGNDFGRRRAYIPPREFMVTSMERYAREMSLKISTGERTIEDFDEMMGRFLDLPLGKVKAREDARFLEEVWPALQELRNRARTTSSSRASSDASLGSTAALSEAQAKIVMPLVRDVLAARDTTGNVEDDVAVMERLRPQVVEEMEKFLEEGGGASWTDRRKIRFRSQMNAWVDNQYKKFGGDKGDRLVGLLVAQAMRGENKDSLIVHAQTLLDVGAISYEKAGDLFKNIREASGEPPLPDSWEESKKRAQKAPDRFAIQWMSDFQDAEESFLLAYREAKAEIDKKIDIPDSERATLLRGKVVELIADHLSPVEVRYRDNQLIGSELRGRIEEDSLAGNKVDPVSWQKLRAYLPRKEVQDLRREVHTRRETRLKAASEEKQRVVTAIRGIIRAEIHHRTGGVMGGVQMTSPKDLGIPVVSSAMIQRIYVAFDKEFVGKPLTMENIRSVGQVIESRFGEEVTAEIGKAKGK